MSLSELIIDIPAEYEMNVFGQFDTYIKKLERTFHVTLISRDGSNQDCRRYNCCTESPACTYTACRTCSNEGIRLRNRM